MVKVIESKQNEKVKEVVKLSKPSCQKELGLFIIEGLHLVEMAKESGLLHSVFTLKELKDIPSDIPQYIVTPEIMDKISLYETSPGVLALTRMKKEKEIKQDKLIYLDDVQDPGNVGTILRTALAFGYKDVLVSLKCASIYNPKVIQASQGAIFKLNVVLMDTIELLSLKEKGYQILATSLGESVDLKKAKKPERFVLVFGNEAHGVNKALLAQSDQNIHIDIRDIDSLNVGVAAGITMYHFKD